MRARVLKSLPLD